MNTESTHLTPFAAMVEMMRDLDARFRPTLVDVQGYELVLNDDAPPYQCFGMPKPFNELGALVVMAPVLWRQMQAAGISEYDVFCWIWKELQPRVNS